VRHPFIKAFAVALILLGFVGPHLVASLVLRPDDARSNPLPHEEQRHLLEHTPLEDTPEFRNLQLVFLVLPVVGILLLLASRDDEAL